MGEKRGFSAPVPEEGPKIEIGSSVPILQHNCIPGKLGQYGKVIEMKGPVPIQAECDNCGKSVAVDIKTLNKPPAK